MLWRSPSAPPLLALCIQHEDGTVHVRSTDLGYGKVARVLQGTRASISWLPDLRHDLETGDVWPVNIRVTAASPGDDVACGEVAEHLIRDGNSAVLAYETFYDPSTDGPVVKFRRAATSKSPTLTTPWVVSMDYGFESGSWVFGSPEALTEVASIANSTGLALIYERNGTEGVESLALQSGSPDVELLRALLEDRGWSVWVDSFTPYDQGDS